MPSASLPPGSGSSSGKNITASTAPSTARPPSSTTAARAPPSSWFAAPAPLVQLFAHFPLRSLPAAPLPACPHDAGLHHSSSTTSTTASAAPPDDATLPELHLFTTPAAAAAHAPSFNPACLQHQTWLRARGVRVRPVPSSNHAAPGGALPFVQLAGSVVPAAQLWQWALRQPPEAAHTTQAAAAPPPPLLSGLARAREAAYITLVEHRLRAAWLLAVYLTPVNFEALAKPLFVHPASGAQVVRGELARRLKAAAHQALLGLHPVTAAAPRRVPSVYQKVLPAGWAPQEYPLGVEGKEKGSEDNGEDRTDAAAIYAAAGAALDALAALLGDDAWFFGAAEMGRLDVVVFSYVTLILDEGLRPRWQDRRWQKLLESAERQALVRHRQRVLETVWGEGRWTVVATGEAEPEAKA